jgi:hypothetical protein
MFKVGLENTSREHVFGTSRGDRFWVLKNKNWVPKWNPLLGLWLLEHIEAGRAGGFQNDSPFCRRSGLVSGPQESEQNKEIVVLKFRCEVKGFRFKDFNDISLQSCSLCCQVFKMLCLIQDDLIITPHVFVFKICEPNKSVCRHTQHTHTHTHTHIYTDAHTHTLNKHPHPHTQTQPHTLI